jgi:hypothetical protein
VKNEQRVAWSKCRKHSGYARFSMYEYSNRYACVAACRRLAHKFRFQMLYAYRLLVSTKPEQQCCYDPVTKCNGNIQYLEQTGSTRFCLDDGIIVVRPSECYVPCMTEQFPILSGRHFFPHEFPPYLKYY